MEFNNIKKLKSDLWQVHFDGLPDSLYKSVHSTLEQALFVRNNIYIEENYRPNNLYHKYLNVNDVIEEIESGQFKVHCMRLKDLKFMPRNFKNKTSAENFASKWVDAHNSITKIYNAQREELFLHHIDDELKQLTPHIKIEHDELRWEEATIHLFGDNPPMFFM